MNQHIFGVRVSGSVGKGGIFNQQPRFNTDWIVFAVPCEL